MTIIPTKFVKTDAGRSGSRRPKQTNDCSVRALALAAGITYDEAYDFLAAKGRQSGRGFNLRRTLNAHAMTHEPLLGHRIIKHSFPAVSGFPRMKVGTFCMEYTNGRFITNQAKHMAAVIDGYLHDEEWNCFRCVYNAFEFVKEE